MLTDVQDENGRELTTTTTTTTTTKIQNKKDIL